MRAIRRLSDAARIHQSWPVVEELQKKPLLGLSESRLESVDYIKDLRFRVCPSLFGPRGRPLAAAPNKALQVVAETSLSVALGLSGAVLTAVRSPNMNADSTWQLRQAVFSCPTQSAHPGRVPVFERNPARRGLREQRRVGGPTK